MAADIHIYVQDAYREAQKLSAVAEEMRDYQRRIQEQEEELGDIWRGASALRVDASLLARSDDASKLADNIQLISEGLRRTAQTYEEAQRKTS